jgi:hypothetical protein
MIRVTSTFTSTDRERECSSRPSPFSEVRNVRVIGERRKHYVFGKVYKYATYGSAARTISKGVRLKPLPFNPGSIDIYDLFPFFLI